MRIADGVPRRTLGCAARRSDQGPSLQSGFTMFRREIPGRTAAFGLAGVAGPPGAPTRSASRRRGPASPDGNVASQLARPSETCRRIACGGQAEYTHECPPAFFSRSAKPVCPRDGLDGIAGCLPTSTGRPSRRKFLDGFLPATRPVSARRNGAG